MSSEDIISEMVFTMVDFDISTQVLKAGATSANVKQVIVITRITPNAILSFIFILISNFYFCGEKRPFYEYRTFFAYFKISSNLCGSDFLV